MDKSGKIAIVITGHLLTDQRMIRTAGLLDDNNFNVHVYYREYFKYKSTQSPVTAFPFEATALRFGINSGIAFYVLFNLRIFFLLLFKKYSCYVSVDSDTLPALTLLSYLKGTLLIFDSHEYFAEVPELEGKQFKQAIWHRVTQMGVNRSAMRYTVSHTLADAMGRRYGKPFAVIANVPAYHQQSLHDKFDRPTIIYQGALNKGRELELLVAAMKKLPDYNCIIIGEGDLSIALRQQAQTADNIVFLGLLKPDMINSYTRKCFLGYNLLDAQSKSYFYSLSNKYFDYMQAGIPSLSSKLPEYERLNAQHNCGLCIDNSEKTLINTIVNLYNDTALYDKLSQNALLASLKNNWENESIELLKLYQKL